MGVLYLVSTPLGNLEDLSPRAERILREVTLIAAENTRHSGAALKRLNIDTPLCSYFEHNKIQKIDTILNALTKGDAALISDAGTPTINDPGYELVRAALAAGFDVRPIPGPSAPIVALSVSGLPTDSFLYLGYLPHKSSQRRKRLEEVAQQPYTLIFLETPHRLIDSLADIRSVLGERQICVAREMTKLYEEYWRGDLSGALDYFQSKEPRGEFTFVIAGKISQAEKQWTESELRAAIEEALQTKKSAKEISAALAEQSGWNKREVYTFVNQIK